MGWVKRAADTHECPLPMNLEFPAGAEGDAWACDECGAVHEVQVVLAATPRHRRKLGWVRASSRAHRKYGPRYTCGCRVGGWKLCGFGIPHGKHEVSIFDVADERVRRTAAAAEAEVTERVDRIPTIGDIRRAHWLGDLRASDLDKD